MKDFRSWFGHFLRLVHVELNEILIKTRSFRCNCSNLDNTKFPGYHKYSTIHLGKGCWSAIGTHILSSISIGDYLAVAANSAVTHSVPSGVLVAGVPAKVIRPTSIDSVAFPK